MDGESRHWLPSICKASLAVTPEGIMTYRWGDQSVRASSFLSSSIVSPFFAQSEEEDLFLMDIRTDRPRELVSLGCKDEEEEHIHVFFSSSPLLSAYTLQGELIPRVYTCV